MRKVFILNSIIVYNLLYFYISKYMIMSRDQNAGRGHSMKIDNSSTERVEEFKYLVTTLTDQNFIQEEMKSRLQGMFAIVWCRIFCLPVCYPKI